MQLRWSMDIAKTYQTYWTNTPTRHSTLHKNAARPTPLTTGTRVTSSDTRRSTVSPWPGVYNNCRYVRPRMMCSPSCRRPSAVFTFDLSCRLWVVKLAVASVCVGYMYLHYSNPPLVNFLPFASRNTLSPRVSVSGGNGYRNPRGSHRRRVAGLCNPTTVFPYMSCVAST